MTNSKQIQINKDLPNKKITIVRYFDASVEQVWTAWTESELLELWWAPKPFRAETGSMNFKPGGSWLYAMVGPDQPKMWCKVDYTKIDPLKSFEGVDMFCDQDGNKNPDFPSMDWRVDFEKADGGTKITVLISFSSEADLQKIVELGFEEGFTSALGNLDELLAKKLA